MKSKRRLRWAHRLLLAASALALAWLLWLPDVEPLKRGNPKSTAYIERRAAQARSEGKKFKKQMIWLPIGRISEHLKHAVVTAEDDMFYRHKGIDWEAVRDAMRKDWEAKRFKYGASTITQQLARNLYLSPSKNPLRKIKEVLIAYKLERALGKTRILELYLNVAEWGRGIYGAEAAARAYFGKSASELTVDEAVAMAVVLPNPRRWKPVGESRYVARNSRRVLARMRKSGLLPEEIEQAVPAEELTATEFPLLVPPRDGLTPP